MAYSVDKGLPLLIPSFARKKYVDSSSNNIKNNKKIVKNKKINKKNKR